jgi:two-component sensor histidine kinase
MIVSLQSRLYALAAIDSIAYLLVLGVALLPSVPFRVKLFAIIGSVFTVGFAVLVMTGPYGAGHLWVVCGVVISALFGSIPIVIAVLGLAAAVMTAYGALVAAGALNHGLPLTSLIVIGGNMLSICFALSYVIHETLKAMDGAMEKQEILSQELHHRVKNNLQVTLSLISLEAYGGEPTPSIVALERRVRVLTAVNELFLARPDSLRMDVRALARAVASCAQQWTIVADDGLEEKTESGPFEMDSADAAHFAIGVGELLTLLAPNTVIIAALPRTSADPPRIRLSLPSGGSGELIVQAQAAIGKDATVASLLGDGGFRPITGDLSVGPGFEIDAETRAAAPLIEAKG